MEADYDLIHSGNYNRLYRRKKAKPDESLWDGKEAVSFDMQSHNGLTAPDHIPVFGGTVYVDGKYGWATRSGRGEFLSAADIPEPYRDIIWGEEDGVFRVALPNGEYKVTSRFCSGDSAPQEINIIANGEKKIKKLRIPKGNETIERSYTVTITDDRRQVCPLGRHIRHSQAPKVMFCPSWSGVTFFFSCQAPSTFTKEWTAPGADRPRASCLGVPTMVVFPLVATLAPDAIALVG